MNGYVKWHERYTEIMEYLHGRSMKAILADDPDYFYNGRFAVDSWESGDTWSLITIGYTVEPYKWSVISSIDNWLWDPFNFENGIIRDGTFSNIDINSPTDWVSKAFLGSLFGSAPTSPTFVVSNSDGLSVRFVNSVLGIDRTVYLIDGKNVIPDFIFYGQNIYTLMFKGVGKVSIDFRVGRL